MAFNIRQCKYNGRYATSKHAKALIFHHYSSVEAEITDVSVWITTAISPPLLADTIEKPENSMNILWMHARVGFHLIYRQLVGFSSTFKNLEQQVWKSLTRINPHLSSWGTLKECLTWLLLKSYDSRPGLVCLVCHRITDQASLKNACGSSTSGGTALEEWLWSLEEM